MEWILIICGVIYSCIVFYFLIGLFRLPVVHNDRHYTVSVLVPARNESSNIVNCLESLWQQVYPKHLYEVFIIDDHSTDNTAGVVENFIGGKDNFYLLRHHPDGITPTYKKQALKFGLKKVTGEIIMTIDADTVADPEWIQHMVEQYDEETGLVAGLVTFPAVTEETIFHKLQTLEFAGIVFCGVGSLGNRNPLICNGSNLSYRRRAFDQAGGYDGNLHLPSGDDDLLLQNIHKRTDWKVNYSIRPGTINYTRPVNTIAGFLNQRARWTSKSIHYPKKWIFPLLFSIYMFYALIFVLLPLTLAGLFPVEFYITGILLKVVPELLIVLRGTAILGRRDLLRWFGVAQIFQIPYILYAGFMGFFNKFSWKDKYSDSA